jgi:hypothetical protein
MADETATPPPAAGPMTRSQEELNVTMYQRVYENFLKKAEEMGKSRGWLVSDILEAAGTMYQQYFTDQVALSKDHKLRAMAGPFLEQLQGLIGRR